MSRSPRLEEGALVGGFLGLVECLFAGATGRMPRTDLVWIWGFDLALGVGVGVAAWAVGALLCQRCPTWIVATSIVAAPAVLFALRGRLGHFEQWASPAALVGLSLIAVPFMLLRLVWTKHARTVPLGPFTAVTAATVSTATWVLSEYLVRSVKREWAKRC